MFTDGQVCDSRRPEIRIPFAELAHQAYMERIDLGAHGFYQTPGVAFDRDQGRGTPFHYFTSGCGLVLAEVDILTGMSRLAKVC